MEEVLEMEEEERRRRMLWPEGERLLFKSGVPSLADLCLDYVADCFQQLEGLGTSAHHLSIASPPSRARLRMHTRRHAS
jgi:hypothetical protein